VLALTGAWIRPRSKSPWTKLLVIAGERKGDGAGRAVHLSMPEDSSGSFRRVVSLPTVLLSPHQRNYHATHAARDRLPPQKHPHHARRRQLNLAGAGQEMS
jgi:hypothetical protein